MEERKQAKMAKIPVTMQWQKEATLFPPGTKYARFCVTDVENRYLVIPWLTKTAWIETDPICLEISSSLDTLEEKLDHLRNILDLEIGTVHYETIKEPTAKLICRYPEWKWDRQDPLFLSNETFEFGNKELRLVDFALDHVVDAWYDFENVKAILLNHQKVEPDVFSFWTPLCLLNYDTATIVIQDPATNVVIKGMLLKNRDSLPRCPKGFKRVDGCTFKKRTS